MRKFVIYFIIYILGLVVQFGWAKYLAPDGIFPNLLLAGLVITGLLRGPLAGELLGFAWGLSWDAMSIEMFGSRAFVFTCAGYLSGLLARRWDESKVSAQLLLVGIASVFYMLVMKAIYSIFGGADMVYSFNYIACLQPFYNMLIAPVIFWVGKRVADILDL